MLSMQALQATEGMAAPAGRLWWYAGAASRTKQLLHTPVLLVACTRSERATNNTSSTKRAQPKGGFVVVCGVCGPP